MKRYAGIERLGDAEYRIRVTAVDPRTGKIREVDRRREGISLQEAVRLQGEWRDEIRRGAEERERPRLRDFARSWLNTRLPMLKASTRARYAEILDKRILPALGDFYVDALTPVDVSAWLAKQGASAPNCLQVLRTICRDAVADLGLVRDPVARVRTARRRVYGDDNPNVLAAGELGRVLDALREREPRWHPLALTLALTGCRWGEVTALRWTDVDERAGVIHVTRAQWRGHVADTKTGASRTVPLVPELAAALRRHRRALVEAQHPGVGAGWLFPSDSGALHHHGVLRKPLARALKAARVNRRLTVHGLRRSFNNLARQVTSGEVVRAIVGHSSLGMTEHYSHVGIDEKQAAAARVVGLVRAGELGDQLGDRADDLDAARENV